MPKKSYPKDSKKKKSDSPKLKKALVEMNVFKNMLKSSKGKPSLTKGMGKS